MKRPVVIGAVVVVVLVLGAGVVFAVTSGDGGKGAAGSKAKSTTTSKPSGHSGSSGTTKPGSATTSSTVDSADPPDPSNAYQPVPLPVGVSATIASCKWASANGGELEASGTITNAAGADDVWLITAVWLQKNRDQNESIALQSDVINLKVGQSAPWHLSVSASSAPPNLSCALEIE